MKPELIMPAWLRSRYVAMTLMLMVTSPVLTLPVEADEPTTNEEKTEQILARVESIYGKGLDYLKAAQLPDGSFPGHYGKNPAVVGCCLMAVLAHGDDPDTSPYRDMVKRCADFILNNQNPESGYIGNSMYNHGFATLALAESYGMVTDARIGPALRKAVALIVSAQKKNALGAWRYEPTSADADTSVTGCQLVALVAARNAGLLVPDSVLEQGLSFIDTCYNKDTGAYGYTNNKQDSPILTAVVTLVRALTGRKNDPHEAKSLSFLRKNTFYRDSTYPFYFEYYMSQALFHTDLKLWVAWNENNISFMESIQAVDGSCSIGSAEPCYMTAMALLSLAVNYRYLPIYEK